MNIDQASTFAAQLLEQYQIVLMSIEKYFIHHKTQLDYLPHYGCDFRESTNLLYALWSIKKGDPIIHKIKGGSENAIAYIDRVVSNLEKLKSELTFFTEQVFPLDKEHAQAMLALWQELPKLLQSPQEEQGITLSFSETNKLFTLTFPDAATADLFVTQIGGVQNFPADDGFNPGKSCPILSAGHPTQVSFPGYRALQGEPTLVACSKDMKSRIKEILLTDFGALPCQLSGIVSDNKVLYFPPTGFKTGSIDITLPTCLKPGAQLAEPSICFSLIDSRIFTVTFPYAEMADKVLEYLGGPKMLPKTDPYNAGRFCPGRDPKKPCELRFPGYKAAKGEDTIVCGTSKQEAQTFYNILLKEAHLTPNGGLEGLEGVDNVLHFPQRFAGRPIRLPVPTGLQALDKEAQLTTTFKKITL
jgi:hypothetical protein